MDPGLIHFRKGGPITAGSKTLAKTVFINGFQGTVNPTKTHGLIHRVVISNSGLTAFFIIDQPNFLRGFVIFKGEDLGFKVVQWKGLQKGIG